MAFFDATSFDSKKPTNYTLPRCGACGLSSSCSPSKIPVSGNGQKGILLVGDFPREHELQQRLHIVGGRYQLLREVLGENGIDLKRDCWRTNALICRTPEDRQPTTKEVQYCRPNVQKLLKELKPKVIIPMGQAAVESIVAPIWKDSVDSVDKWVGWRIPSQDYNAWITPVYDIDRVIDPADERESAVTKLVWRRHLDRACKLDDYPWDKVPDYKKEVKVLYDPKQVEQWINDKIERGGGVSFDYECNRLKPDHAKAEIVSCSVCWKGVDTIAYPFVGEAIAATRRLLASDLPKIGWNAKFEERWTRRILGIPVNNWVWCGMLSSHHLDSREGITSAKFRGLVRLGVSDWSSSIKPYLEDAGNGFNRIHEADMHKLLVYNGIDSLVEYKVACIQRREMQGETV